VALLCDLAPGDVWAPHLPPAQPTHVVGMRHNGTMGASVPFSPSVVIITRWADGTTPAPPASPVPPTPPPQADGTGQALKSMAIELAVERRRASLATVALLNACRDGWADGDSAAAKYLAEAELAAAPPSTPAESKGQFAVSFTVSGATRTKRGENGTTA